MAKCPKCKNEKMKLNKTKTYYECKECSNIEYEEPIALELPKTLDVQNLEVKGVYRAELKSRKNEYTNRKSLPIVLLKHGKTSLYIPNIGTKELKEASEEIFNKVNEYLGFDLKERDILENPRISDVYYEKKRELFPDYELSDKETIYNIFTFKNRLNANKINVVIKKEIQNGIEAIWEHVYKKKEVVGFQVREMENTRYLIKDEEYSKKIFNILNSEIHEIKNAEYVKAITKDYILCANSFWNGDYSDYKHMVIRKSDSETIYYDQRSHDRGCSIVGNRYLISESYQNGVFDLLTKEKIQYPFGNVCSDFVCDVNESGFTNRQGRKSIKKMENLDWTGYQTEEFLNKFNGFLPHPNKIGISCLDGTGGYFVSNRKALEFKNIKDGVFYKKRNSIVNAKTEKEYKVDEKMLKWIKSAKKIILLDKKPKVVEKIDILEQLIQGKQINGMGMNGFYLSYEEEKKRLTTNFLKKQVNFDKTNVKKLFYLTKKESYEIVCEIDKRNITFEVNKDFKTIEVANIG